MAGVYDANASDGRLKIYVNGVLDNANNNQSGNIVAWNPNYLMKVGCWSYASARRTFDGVIDEVTIWTRALSAEEIRQYMCRKPLGNESGLAGYWDYEEGSGFTAFDKTSGGRHGWIFNEIGKAESGGSYTLTDNDKNWANNSLVGRWIAITNGTGFKQRRQIVSNTSKTITVSEAWETIPNSSSYYALTSDGEWCTSTAPVGDGAAWDYSGSSPEDFVVHLAHDDGDYVTVTGSGGTITGIQVYRIDAAPDNTTPPTNWNHLDVTRYWGVIVLGSGSPTYTFRYHYSGNPNVEDENDIGLAYRSGGRQNGLGEPWNDLEAVLDTENKKLTKTGQTGTEYVLIWGENPVAVTLSSMGAVFQPPQRVVITWSAENETGIAGYAVHRANDKKGPYRRISSRLIETQIAENGRYSFLDESVTIGKTYYYQIEAVTLDGRSEWFGPMIFSAAGVAVKPVPQTFRLHEPVPNPFNPQTRLCFDLPLRSTVKIEVFDVQGHAVQTLAEGCFDAGTHDISWDASELVSGCYFIRIQTSFGTKVKRALLPK